MIDCTSAATPHALTPHNAAPMLRACRVTFCLTFRIRMVVVLAAVLNTLSLLLITVQEGMPRGQQGRPTVSAAQDKPPPSL